MNDLEVSWTEEQRTDFWYTLDRLCADANPAVRATPGSLITPEALASEEARLNRLAWALKDGDREPLGFKAWGFYLYADPVIYSFTAPDLMCYAVAKAARFRETPIRTRLGLGGAIE